MSWSTRVVGRDADLAAVCALMVQFDLAPVTLTGPGGMGKARLAVAVASDLRGNIAPRCTVEPVRVTRG